MSFKTSINRPERNPKEFQGPSLTQQHHAEAVNINTIVQKYHRTGILPNGNNPAKAVYGDFTAIDFQTAQQRITTAREAFEALPAQIRARFRNEPVELIKFMENPENLDEAVKLGLAQKKEVKPPEAPLPS